MLYTDVTNRLFTYVIQQTVYICDSNRLTMIALTMMSPSW